MALSRRTANINVATATTDSVLVAAGTGIFADKSIVVLGFVLVAGTGAAGTITFNSKGSGAGTAISSAFAPAASGVISWPDTNEWGAFQTNRGEALTLTTGTTTTNVTGIVSWAFR